jgi:hypothetical protein
MPLKVLTGELGGTKDIIYLKSKQCMDLNEIKINCKNLRIKTIIQFNWFITWKCIFHSDKKK